MVRSMSRGRRSRWAVWLSTLAIAAGAGLVPTATALAGEPSDMVLRWNDNAVTILSTPTTAVPPGLGQGPPVSPFHLAMVHGAIYDAVNAIDGNREAYLYDPARVPRGASKAAAAAQAAHDVLVGLTPTTLPDVKTRIDDMLTASLVGLTRGVAKGQKIGAVAAAAMLADRIGDGRFGPRIWVEGHGCGEWRVVPPANASVFAWTGDVTPFVMKTDRSVPDRWPAGPVQHPVRHRVRRGQGQGRQDRVDAHAGRGSPRELRLGEPGAVHEQGLPRDRRGQAPDDIAAGPALRDDLHVVRRRPDRLLQRQGRLELPGGRRRPSSTPGTTGIRRRSPTPRGCRSIPRPDTRTNRPATTATPPG